MQEIRCPHCGEVFQVDEAGYAAIAQQVRDAEFKKEVARREQDAVQLALAQAAREKEQLKAHAELEALQARQQAENWQRELALEKERAKSALQAFYLYNEDGTNILLQEYIKESAGTDIRAFVVGNKVVTAMQRESLDDDFRSNLHQGGLGTPIKLTVTEKRTALKAARAMGLHICGVDLMRSNRGPLVLEVNASPGFGIEKVTDVDVASKIIEYIELNAPRRNGKDRVGA